MTDMKASKFLSLTVIAIAVIVLSGCEEEDGPLVTESATINPPIINDQYLPVPKDKALPIQIIQEATKKENNQESVYFQTK